MYAFQSMYNYYVYIMTNKPRGTLYVGVTNNLMRRVYEHKSNTILGFTSRYELHKLVFYEHSTDIYAAIRYEKRIKKWNRQWKIELIEKFNPQWNDLYSNIRG